jgi:diacylglycerol kinase family enzyme
MNSTFVIFNPAARGEKSRRFLRFLEDRVRDHPALTLAPTSGPGDAQRLAGQAVTDGSEAIVAAGGDGTINEVINGIGTSGVPVGVLPLGTVNVFARELGVPLRAAAAWDVIKRRRVAAFDLGCADAGGQRRYFVQLAGIGFDAAAIQEANWELKKKIGPLSYVVAGLRVLRRRPRVPAIFIGNGRYYGGPFALFPQALLSDGKLDVCVMERANLLSALAVVCGRHTRQRGVKYFQCETFEHDGELPFELDGELAGTTPVKFSIVPRALRVIIP